MPHWREERDQAIEPAIGSLSLDDTAMDLGEHARPELRRQRSAAIGQARPALGALADMRVDRVIGFELALVEAIEVELGRTLGSDALRGSHLDQNAAHDWLQKKVGVGVSTGSNSSFCFDR